MAPFVGGEDDLPSWARLSPSELAAYEAEAPAGYDEERVPEPPAEVVEDLAREAAAYEAGTWLPVTEPGCVCRHCQPPSGEPGVGLGEFYGRAEEFGAHFRASQTSLALAYKAAGAMYQDVLSGRGPNAAEHVGSHLALLMGVHPRTGTNVAVTAVRAARDVPQLVALMLQGKITDRHVQTLLDEVGKWTDNPEQAQLVLEQTLARCEQRAERYGWPTPGELKKQLVKVAILHDLRAAEKRRQSAAERRGVSLWQTGPGGAALTIEGPDLQLALAYRAIRERATAMKHLEGDTRSQAQREADAAIELLTIDADQPAGGGVSARPTTGLDGEPLELVVRGAHIAVVTPYSVTQGGDCELAEIPGFGPILPSTVRELLEHADSLTRVAVDATTGEVLAVDDAVPGPDRARRRQRHSERPTASSNATDNAGVGKAVESPREEGDEDERDPDKGDGGIDRDPSPEPKTPAPSGHALSPAVADDVLTELDGADTCESVDALNDESELSVSASVALLRKLAGRKVIWRDLCTSSYRVPDRLRRFVEHRDRTCCFPGCTVPGRYCDVDHREEWPRGGTHAGNCHVLCRRHHRAKQFYFADVTIDPATGDTLWTTFEGSTYRRPPPRY